MSTPPITRRSTLKAGAHAAWMVPTVQIVAATPAFAASGVDLDVSAPSASYATDGNGDRPDQLSATATIANNGTVAAENLLVSLKIPAGLYDVEPTSLTPPAGYVAAPTAGSVAEGWTLSWQRSAPLAPGSPETPTFGIQFNDPLTEPPYLSWAGDAFTVELLATPTNGPAATAVPATVAPASLTTLTINEFGAFYQGSTLTLQGLVQNYGRRSTDDVTLTFWVEPDPDDSSAWSTTPSTPAGLSAGLAGGNLTGTGAVNDPYTYVVTHGATAPISAFGQDAPQEDLDHTLVPFRVTIQLGATPETDLDEFPEDAPRTIYVLATSDEAITPVDQQTGTTSVTAFNGPPSGGI